MRKGSRYVILWEIGDQCHLLLPLKKILAKPMSHTDAPYPLRKKSHHIMKSLPSSKCPCKWTQPMMLLWIVHGAAYNKNIKLITRVGNWVLNSTFEGKIIPHDEAKVWPRGLSSASALIQLKSGGSHDIGMVWFLVVTNVHQPSLWCGICSAVDFQCGNGERRNCLLKYFHNNDGTVC